jgi:hypothetical protein
MEIRRSLGKLVRDVRDFHALGVENPAPDAEIHLVNVSPGALSLISSKSPQGHLQSVNAALF